MHGEIDHGFYNFHPTFYWDLVCQQLQDNSHSKMHNEEYIFPDSRIDLSQDILKQDVSNTYGLMVAFEKTIDKPFEIPQQGRYDSNNPDQKRSKLHGSSRGRMPIQGTKIKTKNMISNLFEAFKESDTLYNFLIQLTL